MSLTIITDARSNEILGELKKAGDHAEECDNVLIIMQRKGSGMLWFAPDSSRIETASFMATSFLHWLHSRKEDE